MTQLPEPAYSAFSSWLTLTPEQRAEWLEQLLTEQPAQLTALATELGLHPLSQQQLTDAELDFSRISLPQALSRRLLPVLIDGKSWLLMADPFSLTLRQWAQRYTDHIALCRPGWVNEQLDNLSRQQRTIDHLEQQDFDGQTEEMALEISLISLSEEQSPVIKLVNSTLYDALQSRASDIHLESVPDGLVVKYRIDGVLHAITRCNGSQNAEQVISRLKVLGCMDISERRIPQDGRFKAHIQQRNVDFRVSIMPSIHGEDAVLRVLDKSHDKKLRLETLGFDSQTLAAIRKLTQIPHGMVLVTGPTGSGKSTTLYSALSELNSGESKIITIEDPVEYQLEGVLQIPVNDKKGLNFARGLRAILRHDPDIILVGEIRDGETAGIAVQAALTGHVVLSSVHANSVFSVLERFLYMQVEPASLITALNGVVAQRLVRQVCPECKQPHQPTAEEIALWQLEKQQLSHANWHVGVGCEHCRHSGYHGRLALAEVLHFSDAMKEALLARASLRQLREVAMKEGFVPLQQIAIEAASHGFTTLQEVRRVISLH
ncbi:GspE/PulE family protein [Winslowiella iniecta]|uniref:Type II secretion system protein E n=1 Tax=Winslowiella iniecta TaxID=1560201 RepID=A0A0L7T0Q9_9GAMM|nr:GspE/PulE family protein [Winslowiella iniecta]KOC88875.1 type II secretion system protein E [Winslowiella iniecta]KOC92307.1 type II secretion system protein E [Winslowiella iniecta]